jgi:hypothetical protein
LQRAVVQIHASLGSIAQIGKVPCEVDLPGTCRRDRQIGSETK